MAALVTGLTSKLFCRQNYARQLSAAAAGCAYRRWTSSWAALGLDPREADVATVKRAYFEAARACHPDLQGATPANVQKFQKLSLAVDDVLRELAKDRKKQENADGVRADTSEKVSRDDPDFASSFFEFINREMSHTTRAEIKAAVSSKLLHRP